MYKAAKKIYRKCLKRNKRDIWIFDSTVVTLSAKLLTHYGYQIKSSKNKKQVKYTIGLKNGFPEKVNIYDHKSYNSEDKALGETIIGTKIRKNSIILFDRGLSSRKFFDEITTKGLLFISRLKKKYRIKIVSEDTSFCKKKGSPILKEREGYLYHPHKKTKHIYRAIHVKPKPRKIDKRVKTKANIRLKSARHASKTKAALINELLGEEIIIVTNIPKSQLSAEEVAATYTQRWSIETFFKFIKQELSFSHLVSRTKNGIESMLYISLICALMMLVYKEKNELLGYKFTQKRFMFEAEDDLIIDTFQRASDLLKACLLLLAQFWQRAG